MTGKRLRPQAERAQRRTSARSVKRDERVQQEGNVVVLDLEVALVNIGGKRQRIQFRGLEHGPGRVVHDLAVFDIADIRDFRERLALRVFHDGMIEFAADNKVDIGTRKQALRRLDLYMRTDKGDLQVRLLLLHSSGEPQIALEADGRGEQNKKLVVARGANDLFGRNMVRRTVQKAAAR